MEIKQTKLNRGRQSHDCRGHDSCSFQAPPAFLDRSYLMLIVNAANSPDGKLLDKENRPLRWADSDDVKEAGYDLKTECESAGRDFVEWLHYNVPYHFFNAVRNAISNKG